MRQYTRIVFGLNAIYLTVLGLFCLLGPSTMIGLYGGVAHDQDAVMLQVAFRLIGVKLIPFGVMSALIARDPDDNPMLRALMGLLAVLTLTCYGMVVGMHSLNIGWIGIVSLNVIGQILVLVAVMCYSTKQAASSSSARRHAA